MVKKLKKGAIVTLFVLSGLSACEMPKGVEVTGKPKFFVPLGSALGSQDMSIVKELLDADDLNDKVQTVVESLSEISGGIKNDIPDDIINSRKVWNNTAASIQVDSDTADNVNGRDEVQTFIVYIPACWMNLTDFFPDEITISIPNPLGFGPDIDISVPIKEEITNDSVPDNIKELLLNYQKSGHSLLEGTEYANGISVEPIALPSIGEITKQLKGMQFNHVYLLSYLKTGNGIGDGIKDGHITVNIQKDPTKDGNDDVKIPVLDSKLGGTTAWFPSDKVPASEKNWDIDLASDTTNPPEKAVPLQDLINADQESQIKIDIDPSDLAITGFNLDALKIQIELAIVLPMKFDLADGLETIDIDGVTFRKLELAELSSMQETMQKSLDDALDNVKSQLGDADEYIKDLNIRISDIQNNIIDNLDIIMEFEESTEHIPLGDNSPDKTINFASIKEIPKFALAIKDGENPVIKPIAAFGEGGPKFDFNISVDATANIDYSYKFGGNTPVTLNSIAAGSAPDGNGTTTTLIFTFNRPVGGLSTSDITLSGVPGVKKGLIVETAPGVYTLGIGGFKESGALTVIVKKNGYELTQASDKVDIYYNQEE